MNIAKKLIYLSTFLIVGCGGELRFISTGVSLGGTGDPSIKVNLPPFRTQAFVKVPSKEYILSSKGKIDQQCSGIKLSMQLMDPVTLEKLDIGYGYPINLRSIEHNRRVGIVIGIENKTRSTLYSFSDEKCPSLLEWKNFNQKRQPVRFNSECTKQSSVVILKPGKNVEYKYVFYLPDGGIKKNLIYTYKYSFDNIKTFVESNSCEITYPLFWEK